MAQSLLKAVAILNSGALSLEKGGPVDALYGKAPWHIQIGKEKIFPIISEYGAKSIKGCSHIKFGGLVVGKRRTRGCSLWKGSLAYSDRKRKNISNNFRIWRKVY